MRFQFSVLAIPVLACAMMTTPAAAAPVAAAKAMPLYSMADDGALIRVQAPPPRRGPGAGQGQRRGGQGGRGVFPNGGGQRHGGRGGNHRGDYRHDRGRGDGGAAAAGIIGGLFLGAIIANEAQRQQQGVDYCMQRYRSYDPRSGTYLGNDGYRHRCP